MSDKPSLRDRRRQEARDALYRAMERRDQLIDGLVRNTNRIKVLKKTLRHLNVIDSLQGVGGARLGGGRQNAGAAGDRGRYH